MRSVIRRRARSSRSPIASEVRNDHREAGTDESRRNGVPRRPGTRVTVEEDDGRAIPTMADIDLSVAGPKGLRGE